MEPGEKSKKVPQNQREKNYICIKMCVQYAAIPPWKGGDPQRIYKFMNTETASFTDRQDQDGQEPKVWKGIFFGMERPSKSGILGQVCS